MRIFVAIDIDDNLRAAITALQADLRSQLNPTSGRIKWVDPDLMHLTLKFIGEVEQNNIDRISEAVASAAVQHKSFSFEIPTLGCFGRPIKVIWLGTETENQQLLQLHQDIEDALESAGWPKEKKSFSPHLTLARLKDVPSDRSLKGIIKKYKLVDSAIVKACSVRIYESVLTPTGPIYSALSETKLK